MKVYLVIEGEVYDYNHTIRHVFETREDAETYVKKAKEIKNEFLTIEEFDVLNYKENEPKEVYEHFVKFFEFGDDRPTELKLKTVTKKLDTDTKGNIYFYASGNSIEAYIGFNEERELNKEKAMENFKKIREEVHLEDRGFRRDMSKKNFKRFEKYIREMFE